jgi:hypothetical protein
MLCTRSKKAWPWHWPIVLKAKTCGSWAAQKFMPKQPPRRRGRGHRNRGSITMAMPLHPN